VRTELYHALFTHFPIVLLAISPLWLAFDAFGKNQAYKKTWTLAFRFFFYGGLLAFMINLFLGDEAYEIVKNSACSLALLQRHDDLAHTSLYFYLVGLLYEPLQMKLAKKWCFLICFPFLIAGTYYLVETGHSGAIAVYDHGTGVKAKVCP
jgi:hypothetical protein